MEALKPHGYRYFDYKADVMHWFCKPGGATHDVDQMDFSFVSAI